MNAHTPGPWTTCESSPVSVVVDDDDGRCIAVLDDGDYADPGEAEANASLIAAAPDLLAACLELLASFPKCDTRGQEEAQAQARAAIALAKGDQ